MCVCVYLCVSEVSQCYLGLKTSLKMEKKKSEVVELEINECTEQNCLQPNCMVGNNRRLSDSSIFFDPTMLLGCSAESVNHVFKCRRLNCCYPLVTLKSVETKKEKKKLNNFLCLSV